MNKKNKKNDSREDAKTDKKSVEKGSRQKLKSALQLRLLPYNWVSSFYTLVKSIDSEQHNL